MLHLLTNQRPAFPDIFNLVFICSSVMSLNYDIL